MLRDFSCNGETILLCPASEFYASNGAGADEVRISYCIAQDDLKRAMHILRLGLEAYQKRENS
jgi:aspartate aminotransferase